MIEIEERERRTIRGLAFRACERYPVDRDDMEQELALWMLEHEHEVRQWRDDEQFGRHNLRRALWRRARQVGETEKAERHGYRPEDVFWYSKRQLRALLAYAIFDKPQGGRELETVSGSKEHDDAQTMMIDVRIALTRLEPAVRQLLADAVEVDFDYNLLADERDVKPPAMRKRIDRALGKLQAELGGPQPFDNIVGSRKVISNSKAQAIIQEQNKGNFERWMRGT